MPESGQTRPCVDDPTLGRDERLWRRIRADQLKTEDGRVRPSSAAFRDSTNEVSVHLASLTTTATALERFPGFSLAELTVGFVRDLGLSVVRDPLPDDPSHAFICPCPSKGKANRLSREAVLVVVGSPPLG
jgi:hypothetical protein